MSLGSLVGGAAHCSFGRLGVNAFLQLVSASCDSTSFARLADAESAVSRTTPRRNAKYRKCTA